MSISPSSSPRPDVRTTDHGPAARRRAAVPDRLLHDAWWFVETPPRHGDRRASQDPAPDGATSNDRRTP